MSKRKAKSVFYDAESILDDEIEIINGIIFYSGKKLIEELEDTLRANNTYNYTDNDTNSNSKNKDNNKNIYEDGTIYKIVSKNTDKIYIGSTTYNIEKRLEGHKISYYKYKKYGIGYCASYEIIKYGDY